MSGFGGMPRPMGGSTKHRLRKQAHQRKLGVRAADRSQSRDTDGRMPQSGGGGGGRDSQLDWETVVKDAMLLSARRSWGGSGKCDEACGGWQQVKRSEWVPGLPCGAAPKREPTQDPSSTRKRPSATLLDFRLSGKAVGDSLNV
ncbi:hypothetical protein CFIO01_07043 [Colletotrichum fioriniae PJ7]|uniref:Uncharacterized protein n=1 Tax=Colletotrichum fioriniae PJ7 TaxID=1445577 RepID=A0A010Q1D0_9PEZI|nr:hypothetical protein CFIO01_07043 [Colletotrichum fioriniae PJ7]